MDVLSILFFIGCIHIVLFVFNTIFVSCMHLPYIYLLKRCGLKIQFLRITLFTTAFNRRLMKWGLNRSKFWSMWFNAGMITTIALLPISILIILKMTYDSCIKSSTPGNPSNEQILKLMVPGVNLPFSEIGYYIVALILCSIFHELGHAMAAVKEDVHFYGIGLIIFFIIPVAMAHIDDEQTISLKSRLHILCAGVWHNVILAVLTFIFLTFITLLFSPFYTTDNGVFVKNILTNSPLLGPSGLSNGNVIFRINDCPVKNSVNWQNCILDAVIEQSPGYCISEKMMKELDKSVFINRKFPRIEGCCDEHSRDVGYLCFEHLEKTDHIIPESSQFCLPSRAIVESSHNLCKTNRDCSIIGDICIKPLLANTTKLVQIKRYNHKDVLFFGHPAAIYQTASVTDWVPKFSFLGPEFPEVLILLCKYIAVFSSGLAIINIMPCFYFDGQHITDSLTNHLLKTKIRSKALRSLTSTAITSIFTILLIINMIYVYSGKT